MTDAPDPTPTHEILNTIDELENHCFGCGTDNPQGLQLSFVLSQTAEAQPLASTTLQLTRIHQGAPGFVHGGIIATLMDEAMSKLNRPLGVLAMTRHMEISYMRPAPIGQLLTLTARHTRREGRKLFHTAALHGPEGIVLAQGKGLFVVVDPAAVRAQYGQ